MDTIFLDRQDAGMRLAPKLAHYRNKQDLLVLALPRGGVAVGHEIAKALHCPMDVLIIRKIGAPGNPELAVGAISETGAQILNRSIMAAYGVSEDYVEKEVATLSQEISRRKTLYRGDRDIPPLTGKTIILVDDGVATGATLKAAIATLKEEKLDRLVVALPVAPPEAEGEIGKTVDEWICLEVPEWFPAVGAFYRDFSQVSDEEVERLLQPFLGEKPT